MPKIIRSKKMGFCSGVKHAVETAFKIAEGGCPHHSHIYTLGPLIHNSTVMSELELKGVGVIAESEVPAPHAVVIIRAHGVTPQTEAALKDKGAVIVDATCAKVKANQLKALSLHKSGAVVFIAGEKGHAEVTGLLGYAPNAIVLSSESDAEVFFKTCNKNHRIAKGAIIAQTTISTGLPSKSAISKRRRVFALWESPTTSTASTMPQSKRKAS
ncbi:hypothetical protein FACS1894102_6880 [Spirochaetia bacterium]|nr:hypothetical protein FACS1894102_6880 [Spirochaetia bacterium]